MVKPEAQSGEVPLARRNKVFFRLALVLLSLVFCLAGVEMALRVLYREEEATHSYLGRGAYVQDDRLGYRHAPGFRGYAYRRGEFECPVHISQNGLRQANFEAQRQYPARLLLLGDSFTFGLGVPEESLFATLIQPALNPQGIGVINGGQTGYCLEQEVKFGISLAPTVEPAMIIVCLYPSNDVSGDYYKDYQDVEVRYGYRLSKTRWLPIPAVDFLRTHLYSWHIVNTTFKRARMKKLSKALENLAKVNMERALQPTVDALTMLHDYCQEKNIKLGIMMIPSEQSKTTFDDPLKSFLNQKGIPVLDLSKKDFRREDCFPHDIHWNVRGHEKAAQYLAPFCLELFNQEKTNEPL